MSIRADVHEDGRTTVRGQSDRRPYATPKDAIVTVRCVDVGDPVATEGDPVSTASRAHATTEGAPTGITVKVLSSGMPWLLSDHCPKPGQQALTRNPETTGLSSRPTAEAGGACRMEGAE